MYGSPHPLRSSTTATRDPRAFARPGRMSPAENEAYQLFILAEAGVERLRPIPHEVGPGWRCGCTYRPAG